MSTPNTPFYKNEKFLKWFPFVSLVLALGANLSLNPETKYIARNGGEQINLASKVSESDIAVGSNLTIAVDDKKVKIKIKTRENITSINTKKDTDGKTLVEKENETTVEVSVIETEAGFCASCLEKQFSATAAQGDAAKILLKLSEEIKKQAQKEKDEKKKIEIAEKKEKEKEGKKEKIWKRDEINTDIDRIIAEINEENDCKGSRDDRPTAAERFECYSQNLIEITEALGDTDYAFQTAGASVIKRRVDSYFENNLYGNFTRGFSSIGSPFMNGNNVGYFQARDLAGELFQSLDGRYSSGIISRIEMAQARGISIQAQNAYQAIKSPEPGVALRGRQQLLALQNSIGYDANFAAGNLIANGTMTPDDLNMVYQYFYQPTSTMLQGISKKLLPAPGATVGAVPALTAADFNVDAMGAGAMGSHYDPYLGVGSIDSNLNNGNRTVRWGGAPLLGGTTSSGSVFFGGRQSNENRSRY